MLPGTLVFTWTLVSTGSLDVRTSSQTRIVVVKTILPTHWLVHARTHALLFNGDSNIFPAGTGSIAIHIGFSQAGRHAGIRMSLVINPAHWEEHSGAFAHTDITSPTEVSVAALLKTLCSSIPLRLAQICTIPTADLVLTTG